MRQEVETQLEATPEIEKDPNVVMIDAGRQGRAAIAEAQVVMPAAKTLTPQTARLLRQNRDKGYIELRGGRRYDIHLLENADPSTLFHENAHFFLEMMGDLAYTEGANQEIIDDYETVLSFLGVKSREQIGERQQEKFARAYEQYLREGTAPSEELRGVFAKVKAWMMAVYGQVKDLVTLTPEIRGVFDRMLASEEEIAAAQGQLRLEPVQAILDSMTDAEREEYLKLAQVAHQQGEDELRAALMADAIEVREWWKERRAAIEAEVENEFRKTAGMRALHFLQKGSYIGGEEVSSALLSTEPKARPMKLDAELLVERYGANILKQLPGWKGQYVYARNNKKRANPRAMDPDDMAPLLGFEDGKALVDFLKGAQGYDEAFSEAVERRLQARHGDLLEDRSRLVQLAAQSAQNEARMEQLLVEVRYLRRKLRPSVAENKRRPFDAGEMRFHARRQVGNKRLVDTAPHVYQRNAQKHGNAAFAAAETGNLEKAYDEKVRQVWNMALYRAARDAQIEADVTLRLATRMGKRPAQQRLGLAGEGYRDAMNSHLERFLLRPETKRGIQERQSLREFVKDRLANNEEVAINETLMDRTRVHYRELTVNEMRTLRDNIKNIDHMARVATAQRDESERAEFNMQTNALVSSLDANVPDRGKYDPLTAGGFSNWREGLREWISFADSRLLRLEEVIDRADGRKIEGAWRAYIWEPIVQAQVAEGDLTQKYALKLQEVYAKLPRAQRKEMLQGKVEIEGLGRKIPLQACIAIAFHEGNAGNKQRMMDGGTALMDARDPRWPAVHEEILSKLDPEHWQFVQRIWHTIGGLWPQIEALEERVTGIPATRVDPMPFVRTFDDGSTLDLEGGYFPLAYDAIAGVPEKVIEGGDAMAVMNHPGYVRAGTAHGHTYDRVAKMKKPIRLDITSVPRHLQQVIHDLTHREAITKVYKLLNNDAVRHAMFDQLGAERHKVFNIWLRRVAGDRVTDDARMERFFRKARMNATVVAMAGKATVVTQNFSNFLNVMEPGRGVKGRYLARAMRDFYSHPLRNMEWVHEKSGEMRHRFNNLERDIRHGIEATLSEVQLTPLKKTQHMAQRFGFGMIAMTDRLSAYPAWMGAYAQAIDEGKSEKHARMHADRVLRTVLTSGAPKDIAAIQGGGELNRSLTMFYSWFSGCSTTSGPRDTGKRPAWLRRCRTTWPGSSPSGSCRRCSRRCWRTVAGGRTTTRACWSGR
jgi:hypothetical protein